MAEPSRLGDYLLQRRLGEGGMGEVWEARRESDGAEVALKRLLPGSERSAMPPARFLAEAKLGASLRHPNLVRVLDAGVDGNQPFFVMELLRGASFATLCEQNPDGLPPGLVVALGLQVLAGLAFMHAVRAPDGSPAPVVHRDLKPSNLFLTSAGEAKVFDFGIALSLDAERTETATGLVRGSLPYVSPEHAHGEGVTPASDLFSVALVLHELLTGVRVMNQGSDAAILTALLWKPLPSVRARRPDVPAALDQAIAHALEKDPTRRPPSAHAWAEELRESLPPEGRWMAKDVAAWARDRIGWAPVSTSTADVRPLPELSVRAPTSTKDPVLRELAPVPKRQSRLLPIVTVAVISVGAASAFAVSHFTAKPRVETPSPLAVDITVPSPEKKPETVTVPVPLPEAKPEPVDERARERERESPVATPKPAHRPTKTGWLTVDAQPTYGEITLDGKRLGPTPLYRIHLSAGPHVVDAVREDGLRRTRNIRVAADKESLVLFRW